jgi:hypothetical protein
MEVRSSAVKQSVAAREELSNNEEAVLGCLRGFTSLNGDLGQLERLLYEQTAHLPRPIFKFFRKIR